MQDDPTLELCKTLIREPSVTPEDANCQKILSERLSALGFSNQTLYSEGVTNLWSLHKGQISAHKQPRFVFAGHTDVVPPSTLRNWQTNPFEPTIKENKLYGRGVADMKGSLAAMITATERFIQAYPNYPGEIGFLITSDEEGPAVGGTIKVMEYLAEQAQIMDYCLVGEPSSSQSLGDTIKIGRRGSLGAHLTVKGIQGHVAYPDVARNPIHEVSPALAQLATEIWDEGNAHFPKTTFQVTHIQAGTGASNVIPGDIEVKFNLRFSTEQTSESLQARIIKILDTHLKDYTINWRLSGKPFLTHSGLLIEKTRQAIQTEMGFEPALSTAGGTSDGRFIAPYGVEVVELGPSNATIHKANEHLDISELVNLAKVYYRLLVNLFDTQNSLHQAEQAPA